MIRLEERGLAPALSHGTHLTYQSILRSKALWSIGASSLAKDSAFSFVSWLEAPDSKGGRAEGVMISADIINDRTSQALD